ncbi:MAG: hypothetical protein CO042_03225 [Parcubacteria group bacterium CG_4_9_14_0_2_um_filter_41_8]|nr:MAG: hypothetical protein AUJ34_02075 [Parcubacteria group bacterium CG1_02_41_12]PIP67103.1 MAG: hypothetical protein COW93_02020 [Parcubacteria group bacterium CG22_combo_CG10-13_8_21_14_all_41_9]PIQ80384.1 MAG: hypothetical protein COV79_00770 [Parcubacteria group bacterium CG11_big_fil_rev_8_21_14_0_20_41_14]PIR56660.1 MAG: hypothetical protein COU72_05095 [Parcubacteria group bacterium CG10_big_fil_rev_8_21_14_0_10_41_35]PIZ79967.1 MAG: hypothetical protein COY02_03725 [Parcubacteria gr
MPIQTIIILILGIIIGFAISRMFAKKDERPEAVKSFSQAQSKKKQENKDVIVSHIQQNGRIANNEIEQLLGVSDATATNYLEELEQEGIIAQKGQGRSVYYELK